MMPWPGNWKRPSAAALRLLPGLLILALLAGCAGSADNSRPATGAGASPATTSALPTSREEPGAPAVAARHTPAAATSPAASAGSPGAAAQPTPPVRAAPGFTAPDFTLKRLDTGEPITLSELRGKAVWLNFWTTWCEFCQAEAPAMQAVYEQYREAPLVMLGIDVNEEPSIVSRFVEENGLGWTFAVDRGRRVARLYNVVGQPVHVFIAPNGVVDALIIGEMERAHMEDQVTALLSQAPH